MQKGLTVVMIVRDERENLEELLPGVVLEADEVVVVDTGSTDGTPETARELGARVVEHPWEDHFSDARNRGLDEVETSHAMWLDADDRIESADLATVRREALRQGDAGLMLRLVSESPNPDFVSTCHQLRVFPSRPEHRFTGRIHEQIQPALVATGTPIGQLDVVVRHIGYDRPEQVARKSRRNLELCRREWEEGGRGIASTYHYVKAASLCGEDEEGASVARACIESPPADSQPDILQNLRVSLGRMEWQCGRIAAAEGAYRDAVKAVPEDPFARLHLGELLRLTGRPAEAVEHLEAGRDLPPYGTRVPMPVDGMNRALRVELARARVSLGETVCATGILDEMSVQGADAPDVLPDRAEIAYREGRDLEALALWSRVAAASPDAPIVPLRLGQIMQRCGRATEARPLLLRAMESYDTRLRSGGPDAHVITCLAEAYAGLDEPAAARLGFEEALRIEPGCPEARSGLASLSGGATLS